jgi:hypothetical protein
MRERHARLAPAPDIVSLIRATFGNASRPSFPAKAGNPVRRGLSATTPASGIPGHPPQCAIAHKAGDDNLMQGDPLGHPSCPSFGIAAGRKIRLEQARNAHPGNEPSMVLAEDLAVHRVWQC